MSASDDTYSVLHVCLANARRDEASEAFRYGVRHDRMKALVAEQRPSFLSVKELRSFRTADGSAVVGPHACMKELADAAGLTVASLACLGTRKPDASGPFYLGQAYDASRFLLLGTASCCGLDGAPALRCAYAPLGADGHPVMARIFTLVSVHFPLASKAKLEAARALSGALAHADTRYVCVGDFNAFADDEDADAIHDALTQSAHALVDRKDAHTGEPIRATFFPFPHDPMHGKLSRPSEPDGAHSVVDLVLVSPDFAGDGVATLSFLDDTLGPDAERVSDHLPMIVTIPL